MPVQTTKRWLVSAAADGQAALRYHCNGMVLEAVAGVVERVSPVEHMLMAIAGCFALSCRAVIAKRKLPALYFDVVVEAAKAPDPPSRISIIDVTVSFDKVISALEAESIAAEAKGLCTVSNSIVAAPAITYGSRISAGRSVPAAARSDLPS